MIAITLWANKSEYKKLINLRNIDDTDYTGKTMRYLIDKLKGIGYDSIIYMNGSLDPGSMGVVAFDRNQLLLASIDGEEVN